jgi:predicted ATPase
MSQRATSWIKRPSQQGQGRSPLVRNRPGRLRHQVPLFGEELTKAVLETGETSIPASLHDSLMARLDRIPGVKEVAQTAACIGREFDYTLLAAITDTPVPAFAATLDRLTAAELIFRRGSPPEARYTFKHALVQDAAYRSLLKSKRQQLHARIAKALEAIPHIAETQPELLAHHFTEARLARPAVFYWLKAGELAIRRSATAEAIAELKRGVGPTWAPAGRPRARQPRAQPPNRTRGSIHRRPRLCRTGNGQGLRPSP